MTIHAPPMVYIKGEEMTRYTMELVIQQWIFPHIDTANWKFFDLSCKHRDETKDQVLSDVVEAGQEIKAIFKEPTITPTEKQAQEMGLSKAWGSPNGAMRRGWNGISISRDTIHPPGLELGYAHPVLFDRHAVGGEYGGQHHQVDKPGVAITMFHPDDGSDSYEIMRRELKADEVLVKYSNPLDSVEVLAHHFFARALEAEVTPYVVTKKTVFKWQENFWQIMEEVFNEHYAESFRAKGLLDNTDNQLAHLISDNAVMQLIGWKDGGFAMVAHNYDGDMLTDAMSKVHRSPGFISSSLVGRADDGTVIKEFEACHGTVADMWKAHERGEETSLNPLGLVDALLSAMNHSAHIAGAGAETEMVAFTDRVRSAMYNTMARGYGTRDIAGSEGLTTERFIAVVSEEL